MAAAERGRVLRVALTGGIATGKSHCLRRFAAAGLPTIDSDQLARDAVAAGTPGLKAVQARFGAGVILPDGQLDRAALARIVFDDAQSRRALEIIIHPFVFEAIEKWFDGLGLQAGSDPKARPVVGVADVPLLFETASEALFDKVVVAACEPEQAISRLMARDGLDEAAAQRRVAVQLPIDEKRRRADFVIDTSGSREATDQQVDEVAERLRRAEPKRVLGS